MAEFAAIIPPGEDLIPSTWQVDDARLVVAGRAADAEDLGRLLGALGLIEEVPPPPPEPEPEPEPGPDGLAPCGTYGAYKRHRKQGRRPCAPCRAAHSAYLREYRMRAKCTV